MTELERIEGARRARAAVAYAGVKNGDVAGALHVSPATAGRILGGVRPETTWDELWAIADLCALPRDWFSADWLRLGEIVPAGQARHGSSPALRAEMEQRAKDHVQRVRARIEVAAKDKPGPRRKVPAP